MSPEKWKDILGNIKDNFEVDDQGEVHVDEEGGVDIEYIVFQGPLGKMRLEYVVKPLVIDKKTTYSRRIGSETAVDYVYSDEEKSRKLMVYKWSDENEDWLEIDANNFNL